ncbi:MAG: hypothetical protein JNK82_10820 [Myxococcaceae bacterium]|nr:hypothetical protein [Myxococcaceae bacterium]
MLAISVAFALQLTPPPLPLDVECDSMHAAKIAQELARDGGVPTCTGATIPAGHQLVSAGARLPSPADAVCAGLTPNGCAAHFRDHPAHGLKAGAGPYQAYHFGEAEDLRLADGTRPLLYYKPGTGAHVDDWVFFLGGGAGLCAQKINQRDATTGPGWSSLSDPGVSCFSQLNYANESLEMTVGKGFNMPRQLDFDGQGILGRRTDNLFRDYNVVVLARTNDYFIGDLTRTDLVVATERRGPVEFRYRVASLPLQGSRIVEAALTFFETPPVPGGNDFNAARRVLFATSSSGTNSVHRMDRWRDVVRRLTTRDAYDSEPAYVALMASSSGVTPDSVGFEDFDEDAACGSVFTNTCGAGFERPPRGVVTSWLTDDGDQPIGFDERAFEPYADTWWDGGVGGFDGGRPDHGVAPGGEALPIASVSATTDGLLDESCLATESQRWRCRSTLYVMFNHLKTPLFIAHSLHDESNIKGEPKGASTRDASGNLPRWRNTRWVGTSEEPMARFARFMFSSFANDRDDGAGAGARGDSKESGPLGVWAPTCSGHEPEKSDEHFLRVRMRGLNLSQAASRWFEGGEAGPDVVLLDLDGGLTIDGTDGGCNAL